jgi:two-component system, LytTR family, sensor kinase
MWRSSMTRTVRKWLLLFAVWTLVGLAFASQFNLTQSRRGYPVSWQSEIIMALADWYVVAVLSIPALWLASRFRFDEKHWRRSLAIHLAGSAGFAVLWVALRVGVEQLRRLLLQAPLVDPYEMFHWTLARSFYFNLLVYWIIIGTSAAVDFYRKYRDRELRALELEKLLAQSRLEALQAQLNPHFLFNTLHAISSLMHDNVEAADRMISRLSDLLRLALDSVDQQEVPLRREVAFLQKYLEIEQTRFGDRLKVNIDIAPDTWDATVPNLILQPLVENAIRHGIAPRAAAGCVAVTARCDGHQLHLEVRDDGVGLATPQPAREGVGLSNTRARLRHLYAEAHRFELKNAEGGGLAVRLSIPLRREAVKEPEAAARRTPSRTR